MLFVQSILFISISPVCLCAKMMNKEEKELLNERKRRLKKTLRERETKKVKEKKRLENQKLVKGTYGFGRMRRIF